MRIKHSKGDEIFSPIDSNNVRMYFCGPTVYDRIHIGNIRSFLSADLIFRTLKTLYQNVTYVRNITDIDDKIINKIKEENKEFYSFVDEKIDLFHQDVDSLGLLRPTIEPRVTDHLKEIFDMIQILIDREFAYISNGSVYFSISKYPEGLKLFDRDIENKINRIQINKDKNDNSDFVLWKNSNDGVTWESPWGSGRPGWHIECSAMAKKYLGEKFDIHGGGIDLQFPHHTNENIQSRCSSEDCNTEMAKYWVHSKMLNIDGKKMSKSEGKKIYISELLSRYSANIIKLYFYSTKYNEDFNFSFSSLEEYNNRFSKILIEIKKYDSSDIDEEELKKELGHLYDDFNVYSLINHSLSLKNKSMTKKIFEIIGIDFSLVKEEEPKLSKEEIENLIFERNNYRISKNWKKADEIRNHLLDYDIILKDTPEGTTWDVK